MFLCSLTLSTPILCQSFTRSSDQVFPMRVLDTLSSLQISAWSHPLLLLYLLTLINLLEIMEAQVTKSHFRKYKLHKWYRLCCQEKTWRQSRHRGRRLPQTAAHACNHYFPVSDLKCTMVNTWFFCTPEGPAYLREKMALFLNWFNCSLFLCCIVGTQSVQHL